MKSYIKPKFTIINISVEFNLLDGSNDPDNPIIDPDIPIEDLSAKAQTFRIFDDTDWSDEDY